MGSNDQKLQWNNHTKAILDGIRFVHETDKYTDVTLVSGGEFFPAHRVILGSCSEYFESMFAYCKNDKPLIVLDQPAKFIQAILDYIYHGEVQMPTEDVGHFFQIAQLLKVRGLYVSEEAGDAPFSLSNRAPPVPMAFGEDENSKFEQNLRLSLAHAEYLGTKYRPKGIIPSATVAPPTPATTTASALPSPVNFSVTTPFGLNVVTNQLFGGGPSVRGQLNAFQLKPILDGKKSPPLRTTPPPTKRKRVAQPANESSELSTEQQLPQQKAKNIKTVRANPLPARVSPVSTFLPGTILNSGSAILNSGSAILNSGSAINPTTLLLAPIPSTSSTTTTTAATTAELLNKLEAQVQLAASDANGGQQRTERPASPSSLAPHAPSASATEAGFEDPADQSATEALNLMPQVKIEMDEDPEEQRQLDSVIRGSTAVSNPMEGNLLAKAEPDDSDDQRLLVDDSAGADDEGGHEGRSSSSSSSQGTEFGCSSADPNGSSVQDFLQNELHPQAEAQQQEDQHQDYDGSSNELPSLVMNVDPEAMDVKGDVRCEECDMIFASANLLRRHKSDKHKNIRKHFCDRCDKVFKRKEHLDRHNRIHTGSKPFQCPICGTRFTQKEHLKGHVENVHEKLGKKSARNKAKKAKTSPKPAVKRISKLTNGTAMPGGGMDIGNLTYGILPNQGVEGEGDNQQNGAGGLLDRMVNGEPLRSSIGADDVTAALTLIAAANANRNNNNGPAISDMDDQQLQQQRLALICSSSSGSSCSPPMLTSPPALAQAPSHPLHSTSSSSFVQQSSQFRPIARPFTGSIVPAQGMVSIFTLPNINNGGSAGPATTSFMPFNPIPLTSSKSIVTSLGSSVFQANLPNTRFSSSSPTHDDTLDDGPSISIDPSSSPLTESSSPLSSMKQITVVAGASGHVEAVVSPTRTNRRGRGRGRGGLGRGGATLSLVGGLGRGASPAGAKIALENTKKLIGKINCSSANVNASTSVIAAREMPRLACAAPGMSVEREATTAATIEKTSAPSQQLTAVYAPVTRNSVSSPEKHMKTVVLNIP